MYIIKIRFPQFTKNLYKLVRLKISDAIENMDKGFEKALKKK